MSQAWGIFKKKSVLDSLKSFCFTDDSNDCVILPKCKLLKGLILMTLWLDRWTYFPRKRATIGKELFPSRCTTRPFYGVYVLKCLPFIYNISLKKENWIYFKLLSLKKKNHFHFQKEEKPLVPSGKDCFVPEKKTWVFEFILCCTKINKPNSSVSHCLTVLQSDFFVKLLCSWNQSDCCVKTEEYNGTKINS